MAPPRNRNSRVIGILTGISTPRVDEAHRPSGRRGGGVFGLTTLVVVEGAVLTDYWSLERREQRRKGWDFYVMSSSLPPSYNVLPANRATP